MINIIYKPVKPSHFKKLQTIQNIKTLMFESHLHISERTLIKQIIVSYTPPYCWGKQIFERMLPMGMSNFLLLGCDMMTRTWGRVLNGERHEKKCLKSMHFLGM